MAGDVSFPEKWLGLHSVSLGEDHPQGCLCYMLCDTSTQACLKDYYAGTIMIIKLVTNLSCLITKNLWMRPHKTQLLATGC